jgi:hypothetical protein
MDTKKVIAIGVAGLLIGGLGGAYLFPNEITNIETKEVIKEVPVPGPTIIEYKDVIVEKNVTVEKIVEVDNGDLDEVMAYIHDNVDEDLTVEYIVFETESKMEAEAFIRDNMVSLLNDNDFFDDGNTLQDYRKSEVSIKKINDAVVLDTDFENKDVSLEYEVKVRAKEGTEDAEYFSFKVMVPFEDGKMIEEDVEVELI